MITEATILFAAGGALAVLGVCCMQDATHRLKRSTQAWNEASAMLRATTERLAEIRAEQAKPSTLPAAPVSSLGHD